MAPSDGTTGSPATPQSSVELLRSKAMACAGGAVTANLIWVGDELGLYKAMKTSGKVTSQQLADATGLSERWVREWAFQQAAAGMISTDDDAKHFWLDSDQQKVFADEYGPDASPYFAAGFFQKMPSLMNSSQKLLEAFKTGRGIPFDDHGPESACATCRNLGVFYRHNLVKHLCAIPGLQEKLEKGISIADVGCGCGEALFVVAREFPNCFYHGYDISQVALDLGKQRQAELDLSHCNITFHNPAHKGGQMPAVPTHDLIFTFDALHDMTQPLAVMKAIRQSIKDDGIWISCDPRGLPSPGENIRLNAQSAAFLYGMSVHICMSSGLSEEGGMGLGTLGYQEDLARGLTAQAGFSKFEVLSSWASPFNNYFKMTP